jgi:uncharacterized membrane protein
MNPRKAVCFLAVILIACASLALAQVTYTQIDYPGSVGTVVTGINSAGDMVGSYHLVVGGPGHGFVLSQGQFRSFDYPGAVGTGPNGINDLGQVVGTACIKCGFPYMFAFLYDGQTFTQISYPGRPGTEGNGINNAGDVVGRIDGYRSSVAFKFRDGQFKTITVPGKSRNEDAQGINNSGEIVGGSYKYKRRWQSWAGGNGTFHYLHVGIESVAFGLNDNGVIVGWWFDGSAYSGFAWSNGKFISLRYPGAYSTTAIGINNSGQVVGYYAPTWGSPGHGFVTSPITDADFEAAETAR